ncbi:DedA family protein [Candidatus Saccharibacteria bacterium]|nr:DedA family protein [Candidatus Saccharibacteria bacterium]
MERLGEPGVGLLVLLENLFPPIPSEIILPLAGFTASQGEFTLIGVIFWATLGSVIGAIALYYVGAILGRERTRYIFQKMPLVSMKDVDKTEAWFIKHEVKTVFFGRMVPIFRSLISIPAGVERMNMTLFILYTAAGSLIWNSTLVTIGFILGENFHLVAEYVSYFQYVVIALVLAGITYFIASRLRSAKINKSQ